MRMLAAAGVLLMIAGCSDGGKPKPTPTPTPVPSPPPKIVLKPYPFEKGTASISGRVVLKEEYKPMSAIDMTSNEYCAKCYEEPLKFETIITGEGGTLKNAVVYVSKGLEEFTFKPPQEPVVMTHKGCMLKPHVITVMVGQKVLFKNLDETLHNINAVGYFGAPMPKPDNVERVFEEPGMQHFKCDAHAWESAKCMVLDHPFSAVTDIEGKYEIKGLVPDTYTLSFWHETEDKFAAPDQTITLKDGEQRTDVNADFTKK
ncbi:MAG: carboxypeptidase regulatory-like domain-containing protein [Planctomycetes bacterium]|nr:carboxypeptidase regulatory-like domain-containing protein [Planctomycetota bacterium]